MIYLESVSKSYLTGGRRVDAVRGVTLNIEAGEIFGIVGHSGAGKSTLVRLINRLETPSSGSITVDGINVVGLDAAGLCAMRQRIGMIFQHFNLLSSRTVAQNIAIPLRVAGWKDKAVIAARVTDLLALVGLEAHRDKYPSQLSGGQKQRVGIARALANRPQVLLCDEATSALDPQTTQSILELLGRINRELGITMVVITHEMDVVRTLCDRVAVMDAGQVVEQGRVTQVFLHPEHPTTQLFVRESEHLDDLQAVLASASIQGRIARLTFVGAEAYSPYLSNAVRDHGLDFTILAGSVGKIKDTPCGQLIVALLGDPAAHEAPLGQLQQQGVTVEFLK